MVYELRTYSVRPGHMAPWLALFESMIAPLHRQFGIALHAAWRPEGDEHEFVWLRSFPDEAQRQELRGKMYGSAEWQAIAPQVREHLASTSAKTLLPALPTLRIADGKAGRSFVCDLRTYQMATGRTEEWLAVFQAETLPLHEEFGIPILGVWRTEGQEHEVVWMRGYPLHEDRQAWGQRLTDSPQWQAHLARIRGLSVGRESKVLLPVGAA